MHPQICTENEVLHCQRSRRRQESAPLPHAQTGHHAVLSDGPDVHLFGVRGAGASRPRRHRHRGPVEGHQGAVDFFGAGGRRDHQRARRETGRDPRIHVQTRAVGAEADGRQPVFVLRSGLRCGARSVRPHGDSGDEASCGGAPGRDLVPSNPTGAGAAADQEEPNPGAQPERRPHPCAQDVSLAVGSAPGLRLDPPCVSLDLGVDAVYPSLSLQLQKFQDELNAVAERGFPDTFRDSILTQKQLREKGVQEYAVDITLDTNTAHPRLILSENLKSVWYSERTQLLPDNPERFDRVVCVLGQQEICSGRHYWEVEVGGKTDWDLGVAKASINRKGKLDVTPANGYWFLSHRDKKKYAFRTLPSTDVDLTLHPHKIGIFVDYDNGQVSFYNVDAKIHIYTFNDWFHDSIVPFFSPCVSKNGKNEAPLIITPVRVDDYRDI
uniref:B30.2/SPRY domain-containing protein n=1 Tax=Neogobius melanostomus TaxID=47308 RepID=A0A8C6WMQ3_9GOBI